MDFSQLLETLLPTSGGLLIVRAIVAAVLVFFLPGFAWTLVFFHKVNIIERIALSVGLSIALVTLGIIVLNVLFGMRINGINAVITVVVITVIPAAIYFIRRYLARRAGASDGD